MTKHFRGASLSPELFTPPEQGNLSPHVTQGPKRRLQIGLPVSLHLIELPWFSLAPLALPSSLRALAVLLPHPDSTQ